MLYFQQYNIKVLSVCSPMLLSGTILSKAQWTATRQGSTTFSPSHRYLKVVSNTSRDTKWCSSNNIALVCAEFSYFLSLFSQILFLGTILSKAQYIAMVPGFHLIITSLWVEKRFYNTSWGLIYCPNNGTTLCCAVVSYFLRQCSKT